MITGGIITAFLLIAFFAGVEVAFVSVNKFNIELKKKQGRTGGIIMSRFMDKPPVFIGTTLVGYTLFLVIFCLLVGSVWTFVTGYVIKELNINNNYSLASLQVIRLIAECFLSTFVVVCFAEFTPKAIWRAKSDWLLSGFFASIVDFFSRLFYPIASFLASFSEAILKYLFNVRVDARKDAFSLANLEHYFQTYREHDSETQEMNTELFENALSLPNVKVRQCLIPRKEIVGVNITTTVDELRKKIIDTKLSKLLVYENNIDHIVGYVHQLDLFKKPADIQSILLPIPAIPESMSATDLISKFTKERKSIAWVVDEFGGTAGIVTMEDLLEEIFGEIKDEYDTEEFEEKKVSDEEYIFSGRLELDHLREMYNLEFPEDESETLSGYIINEHETIPKVKQHIIIGDYEFEILSVSDTRIEMVRLKILK